MEKDLGEKMKSIGKGILWISVGLFMGAAALDFAVEGVGDSVFNVLEK